jgi:molecular chaperone DnaK
MSENKDKIAGPDFANIEALIKEGREAVEKQDDTKVQDVSSRLEKEAHRIAGVMYGATGGGPAGGPPGAEGPMGGDGASTGGKKAAKDGDVIDAEFEETGG